MEKTGFCDVGCGSQLFWGVFGLYLFLANLPLNMLVTLDSNFFHENLLENLSPKNRKFRSSRGSETRRKLDSVKYFVFWGVFGLYLFLASLPLNMLVTLDSNLFESNLVQRIKNLDFTNMIKIV